MPGAEGDGRRARAHDEGDVCAIDHARSVPGAACGCGSDARPDWRGMPTDRRADGAADDGSGREVSLPGGVDGFS